MHRDPAQPVRPNSVSSPKFMTDMLALFLMRTAGLPVQALGAMRSPQVLAQFDAIAHCKASMAGDAQSLQEAIHTIVGTISPDPAHRDAVRTLIALKRDLHNNRPVKDNAKLDGVVAWFSPADQFKLSAWRRAACELQALEHSLPLLIDQDLEAARRNMYTWCTTPTFRRAYQIANIDLEQQLDRHRDHPYDKLARKQRIYDNSLSGFFRRAASKTSPFSTFGLMSYGTWQLDAPRSARGPAMEDGYKTHSRINAALLVRLASWIDKRRVAAGSLPLSLNPSTVIRQGRVHFSRPRALPLEALTAFGTLTSHVMFSLPLTPATARVLAALDEAGTRTAMQLALAASPGPTDSPELGLALIGRLFDTALLEPAMAYDAADYQSLVQRVASGASELGEPCITDFITLVDELTQRVDTDDIGSRRQVLRQIAEAARGLCEQLPSLQFSLEDSTILYEDGRSRSGVQHLDIGSGSAAIGSLKALQQLQPIFDNSAPLRVALIEYFKTRFGSGGRCRDVGQFAERFSKECAGPFWNGSASAARLNLFEAHTRNSANVRASMQLRTLRKYCWSSLWRLGRASSLPAVTLPIEIVAKLLARMPTRLHTCYSTSIFAQRSDESSQFKWVINKAYGGSGQLMSRLLYLWTADGDAVPKDLLGEYVARNTPRDAMVAEVTGNEDSNLNLHPSFIRHAITCTGSRGLAPDRATLAVDELEIVHCPETDTLSLMSTATGLKVLPVYVGGLVNQLLPEIQKLLLLFGPAAPVAMPTWEILAAGKKLEPVMQLPRVALGEMVVLRRAWAFAAGVLPQSASADSDAMVIARLLEFKERHQLDPSVYITFRDPVAADGAGARSNARKPVHVDFCSVRSLLDLQRELNRVTAGTLWVTEALPDPVREGSAPHHTEHIFDLTTVIES